MTGTYYRQRFTDKGFDTTNTRQPTWPGFPLYGTQGSWREAYTGGFRSSLGQSLVNDARVAYSGAPVEFGPYHNPEMYNGPLANQGRFSLGLNAGCGNNCTLGITNAGPAFTPSARNATTLTISDTVTWLKGSHSISLGGEYGQFNVWLDNYGTRSVPSITFGTPNGDPASALFSATNFPGSSATVRAEAAAMYGMLTGRVTQIGGTARLGTDGQYTYLGDSTALGRLRQSDLFIQDNWRMRPNLSVNLGLRYAMQMPFYAGNNSYSTVSVEDVWGISGYKSGCDMSNPTPANCNLFQAGVQTGDVASDVRESRQGREGVQRRLEQPCAERRRQLDAHAGRRLAADAARRFRRVVDLGRVQPRVRSARHERLHRRVRRESGSDAERQPQPGQRQPDGAAPAPRRQPRATSDVSAVAGAEAVGLPCCPLLSIR